jgi:predicted  nucleic acid-binding Zn-ribbon protein
LEAAGKREREEDRKALGALRAKNEHLLHEAKKKEQEVARLKDQLKKNNEKVAFRNSFEVYQNLIPKNAVK